MYLLNVKEENGYKTSEYTKDGVTISHTIKEYIQDNIENVEITYKPSIEEQILFETKYQTMILEMGAF